MTTPPTHICIGMARSGTTWLFEALSGIDALFVPPAKEVRYWFGAPTQGFKQAHTATLEQTRTLTDADRAWLETWSGIDSENVSADAYRDLMGQRGKPALDISPSYAGMHEYRIPELRAALPEGSKVFVLLRNPYDRLCSEVKLHAFRHGKFRGPATDWMIEEFISFGWRVRIRNYNRIVTEWRKVFGDDFRAFYHDDIEADPVALLKDVMGFLDLPDSNEAPHDLQQLQKRVNTDTNTAEAAIYPKLTKPQREIIARATLPEIEAFSAISPDHAARWKRALEAACPTVNTVARPVPEDAQPRYQRLLRLTENLGEDAAFSTLQQMEGYQPSSLFQWTRAPVRALVAHLQAPSPLFEKDALRVVEGGLLDTRSGITFRSDLVDLTDSAPHVVPDARFEEIWQREKARIDALAYKFWHFSVSRPGIYVIKSNGEVDAEGLEKLAAALQDRHPQHKLLHVAAGGAAGVERQQGAIIHAHIPVVADDTAANRVDMPSWRKVLNEVLDIPEVRDMVDTMFV